MRGQLCQNCWSEVAKSGKYTRENRKDVSESCAAPGDEKPLTWIGSDLLSGLTANVRHYRHHLLQQVTQRHPLLASTPSNMWNTASSGTLRNIVDRDQQKKHCIICLDRQHRMWPNDYHSKGIICKGVMSKTTCFLIMFILQPGNVSLYICK